MELRVLNYFLMVAREENISRAAMLLHMTQPTLSRQIRALEEELQVTLFTRDNHHLKLTEDGFLLRRYAQEIVELAEKARGDLIGQTGTLSGRIAIGAGETRNVRVLAGWMKAFQEIYPLVKFVLESDTADIVQEKLEKGLIDIGLMMEPVDVSRYQVLRMPLWERYGALMRADHALARKETLEARDLLDVPLILPKRLEVQSYLRNWLADCYEQLHVVAMSDLWFNGTYLVEAGMGIRLCCDIDCCHGQSDVPLRFVPLAGNYEVGAVLGWKKQILSRTARTFLEFCRERAREGSVKMRGV